MNDRSRKFGEGGKAQPGGEDRPESPDAELLAALAAGKAEAFWCLWIRHRKTIHRLCLRETNGHAADAEDALSQVMLKALDRLPRCAEQIMHPEAWLRQLARNLCIDLRRERYRRYETAKTGTHRRAEPKSDPPLLHVEEESEIQQRIDALPLPCGSHSCFTLSRKSPPGRVASRLGLSPANVRKRVQLARTAFAARLPAAPTATATRRRRKNIQHLIPANRRRGFQQPGELFSSAAVIRTVWVKLPCGVEQLFHVFPAKAPFRWNEK